MFPKARKSPPAFTHADWIPDCCKAVIAKSTAYPFAMPPRSIQAEFVFSIEYPSRRISAGRPGICSGKSPAGIFRLSSAFGYVATNDAGAIKLPYTHLTGTIECVDDVKSEHYNTILDRRNITAPDWNSSEQMRLQKDYYRWGVVVDHNAAPIAKGGGSCIFLHIWNHAGAGTAGCTAMEGEKMEELMRWLDPVAKPLLVQLTEAEYKRLCAKWQLPERK